MRYERAKLVGRNWHKIIISHPRNEKTILERALSRLIGDYMVQSGGHWHLVMIDTEDDLVMFKLMTGFTDDEYRGYGDWSKMKYHSAAGNRIHKVRES